jgi:hypothetical protein
MTYDIQSAPSTDRPPKGRAGRRRLCGAGGPGSSLELEGRRNP